MPTYETLYIAQPDMAEADAEALGKSFEELVSAGEGTLMKSAAWGKRKLAYLVKKHQEGLYFYMQFEAAPDVVAEMERRLRNHEEILKYLSVRLDRIAVETLAAADKKAEERAAARAVREAERAERQKAAEEEAAAAQAKADAAAPAEKPEAKADAVAPAEAKAEKPEAKADAVAPAEAKAEKPEATPAVESASPDAQAAAPADPAPEVKAEPSAEPETKPEDAGK